MAGFLERHGVITMELYAEDCGLEAYQNEHGMVGIMIGVEHPELPRKLRFPGGEVILASVQILTPDELTYVAEARAEGRQHLHAKLKAAGVHHFLTPGRPSLAEPTAVATPAPSVEAREEQVLAPQAGRPATPRTARSPWTRTKPWWQFW